MTTPAPDPRICAIELDEATIHWRSADVEQERRIAIFDLLEGNLFRPLRAVEKGFHGPYRVTLGVDDGRLVISIAAEDGTPADVLILAMGRFRRPIREYFAICDSYFQAVQSATPAAIETIDMTRRAIHNDAAEQLVERLSDKIEIDFDTARRLFTLICVLHMRH